jgi:hypothetical protein
MLYDQPILLTPTKGRCRRWLWRFVRRNVPHPTKSGNTWCLPAGLAFFIGGTWDTGNGYAWTPPLWRMVNRYYAEKWHKAGYTLWSWIFQTPPPKRHVPPHGLWSSPNMKGLTHGHE